MHVGLLLDLRHRRFIGQSQALVDVKRTKCCPLHGLGRRANRGVDLGCIGLLLLLPGDQLGQQHPAVVRVEFSAKRQMELVD